jgi:hypothetical protein
MAAAVIGESFEDVCTAHDLLDVVSASIQVVVYYLNICIVIDMEVTRKPLHFVGSSHDDLKAFPWRPTASLR